MLDVLNNPYLISLIASVVIICINIGYDKYTKKEKNYTYYLKIFSLFLILFLGAYFIKGDIKIGKQKGGGLENNIQIGDQGF